MDVLLLARLGMVSVVCSAMPPTSLLDCDTLDPTDFRELVKENTFVDKSLLVKDLFDGPLMKWITAPRGFGKSTNMNMVKVFLEIQVDQSGHPLNDTRQTSNYQLFHEKNLTICKDGDFVRRHLGRHPVVHIDYEPLRDITGFKHMIRQFAKVLKTTFLQHKYLLGVQGLWVDELNVVSFKKYIDSELSLNLRQVDIEDGFTFLCATLHRHFGQKVILLIDNFDSFVEGLIFKVNPDMGKITSFFQSIHEELLKSNTFLDRALITGVLKVDIFGSLNRVTAYSFLGHHPFNKYYGMSDKEFSDIEDKVEASVCIRPLTRTLTAKDYFGGYNIKETGTKLLRTGSVKMFFTEKEITFCPLCRGEYFDNFKSMFKSEKITELAQQLLKRETVYGGKFRTLTKEDVLALNDIVKYGKAKSDVDIKLFLIFLYHLGYLTPAVGEVSESGEIPYQIPNKEISHELIRLLYDSSIEKYYFKETCIQQLHEAVDTFLTRPMELNGNFQLLCKALNNLLKYSSYIPRTGRDFNSALYGLLLKIYSPESEIFMPVFPEDSPSDAAPVMLLFETQQTAIFIETEVGITGKIQTMREKHEARQISAQRAHALAVKKSGTDFSRPVSKTGHEVVRKICVGIGVDLDRHVSIAYSCFLKDGGAESTQFISPVLK